TQVTLTTSTPLTTSMTTTATSTSQTTTVTATSGTGLTQEEINGLLFMREEEKLARDVYLKLYEMYGLQIFKNIAESEQRHTDAVLSLIEKYNLTDPAINEVGVFRNQELQELYNKLIEQGSRSLADALKVGALIEEKDIIDINKLINETKNPDIIRVYTNLVNGSAHHLAAFVSEYEQVTGEPYHPQLLSQQQFEKIISSITNGPGNGHGYKNGSG
ncbi:MAG: DUF2202 domain-containing protein, partial [Desulfurococcales archaeon]|nr:DUF2202 domain-containing protein [Desulfurococcales archaeon]